MSTLGYWSVSRRTDETSPDAPTEVTQVSQKRLDPSGEQATSGTSVVRSDDAKLPVRMRAEPRGGDNVIDELPDNTNVTMNCWWDGWEPLPGTSSRWFIVTQSRNGPHPGVKGWVWSELVWEQIKVPKCAGSTVTNRNLLADSRATVRRGDLGNSGYRYVVELTGLPPGWHAKVECYDDSPLPVPGRAPKAIHEMLLVADAAGRARDDASCTSALDGEHWVEVRPVPFEPNWIVRSNRAVWDGPRTQTPTTRKPGESSGRPVAPQPSVNLARGPAAPAGYRYAITLERFPAHQAISVTCRDSVNPEGFFTLTMRTDGSGGAYTESSCYSGDGPDHWVTAGGVESNRVRWTVPKADPPPPPPPPAPRIDLAKGGTARYGWWYSVVLSGFAPGSSVTVTCRDSVDPGGFWTQAFTIGGDGRASDSTLCYSGDGPDHWVTGGGVESNHVGW
ncbi:hypothetical protein [Micromonospora aurantiaca (nom. illeg.)]|uniref:hypothetical protein n=1 Tax=Micromonospora aurantiaca (nom. illeg.) TaxID=47850 RepID=UPI00365D5684